MFACRLSLLCITCLIPSCSSRKENTVLTAPSGKTQDARLAARDAARLVMERHCGECHIPDSPQALPRALRIYDLRKPEWANSMNEGQLLQLEGRLREPFFDPFDNRNLGKPPPPGASPDEIATVATYVKLELAFRGTSKR